MVMAVEGVTMVISVAVGYFLLYTKSKSVALSLLILIFISRKLIDCCPVRG